MERGVAQMNRIFNKARSLCAVLLSGALAFSGAARVHAEETTATTAAVTAQTTVAATTAALIETTSTVATAATTSEAALITTATTVPATTTNATATTTQSVLATTTAAVIVPPVQTLAGSESYVYNVTITFGSFDFYYDYGTWDSQNLKYSANQSSTNPAAGTVNTFPGWYGFDGTANKISVENSSTAGGVQVTVQYADTPLAGDTTDNIAFPFLPDSVTMSCYDNAAFTMPASGAFENGCSFPVAGLDAALQPTIKDIYVSFSGKPLNTDGTNFVSAQTKRIGYITLTVSLPDAVQ